MSTKLEDRTEPTPARSRTWTIAVAAVGALVLAVVAALALTGGDQAPVASEPPLELEAGTEDVMAACLAFSPEELDRVAEIAFAGTVVAVDGARVTLDVETWFRGGDATQAVLNAPEGMEALIGGIPFVVGDDYLISAQGGTVNYCGFSGPATPELRTGFKTAFGSG